MCVCEQRKTKTVMRHELGRLTPKVGASGARIGVRQASTAAAWPTGPTNQGLDRATGSATLSGLLLRRSDWPSGRVVRDRQDMPRQIQLPTRLCLQFGDWMALSRTGFSICLSDWKGDVFLSLDNHDRRAI